MPNSSTTPNQNDASGESQGDAAEFELAVGLAWIQDGALRRKLLDLALNLAVKIDSSPYETFRRAMVLYDARDEDFSARALQFARETADHTHGRQGFPAWLELAVIDQTYAGEYLARARGLLESFRKSLNDEPATNGTEISWEAERALWAATLAMLATDDVGGADTLRAIEFGLHWWNAQKYRPEFMDGCVAWLPDSALPKAVELLSVGGCKRARNWLKYALKKRGVILPVILGEPELTDKEFQLLQDQELTLPKRITRSEFARSIESLLGDTGFRESNLNDVFLRLWVCEAIGEPRIIVGNYTPRPIGEHDRAKPSGEIPALEVTLDTKARRDRGKLIELLSMQFEDVKSRGDTDALLHLGETLVWTRQFILDSDRGRDNKR